MHESFHWDMIHATNPLTHAARKILEELQEEDIPWVFCGSFGLLAQGMPLSPKDLRIETTAAGANRIAEIFAGAAPEGGVFEVDRVKVDVVADYEVDIRGDRIKPDHWRKRLWVNFCGTLLPVLPAEDENRWCLKTARTQGRAEAIYAWLLTLD